jgi:cation diffusion facilitator CzcD-associated flavoprotein CzcO
VTERGIVTADGKEHAVDAIIYATGFASNDFLAPMDFIGRGRQSLQALWKDGAHAYLGMTVAGFPNFFILYGPNTNLGHNSIIFMIERQVSYIVQCVRALRDRGLRYLDVRQDVMEAFNRRLQADLGGTVWAGGCRSWYKNEAGKIVNNWSSTTINYWWRTRTPNLGEYVLAERQESGQRAA